MAVKRGLKYLFLLFLILRVHGNLCAQSFYVSISSDDDTEICMGDSVEITLVFYFGSAPYWVVISDKDGMKKAVQDADQAFEGILKVEGYFH